MSLLLQNLSYACRVLRRQPTFSSVAILTLALGIGATTAVFTVVYGVLLRPLPFRDPGRLVMLMYGHQGTVSPWFSPPNFRDYVAENNAFSGTAALTPITVNMTGLGEPERLQGARVSWNYFDVLGVGMAHGRAFVEADNQSDGNRIVLSHGLWRRRFGGRLGRHQLDDNARRPRRHDCRCRLGGSELPPDGRVLAATRLHPARYVARVAGRTMGARAGPVEDRRVAPTSDHRSANRWPQPRPGIS